MGRAIRWAVLALVVLAAGYLGISLFVATWFTAPVRGPEDRLQLYKMLRLKVTASQDGSLKVNGAFGDNFGGICESERAPRCTTQSTKGFEIEFHVLLTEDGVRQVELARA